jgi:tetratricopeptide (TPR) repeat protein
LLTLTQTKWTAATRIEVADGTHLVKAQGAATQVGLTQLQETLQQLTSHIRDIRQQDDADPSLSNQSQAYLKYRMRKLNFRLSSFSMASQTPTGPTDATPWLLNADMVGDKQHVLDIAVDRLVNVTRMLEKSDTTLEQVFPALQEAARGLRHAHFLEDSVHLLQQSIALARALVRDTSSSFAKAWLGRLLRSEWDCLRDLDQEEALAANAQEAVDLFANLYQTQPAIYRADLARSLQRQSSTEGLRGNCQVAFEVGSRAVELVRQLAAEGQEGAAAHLRDVINTQSKRQAACGHLEDALHSMQELVALTRPDYQRDPTQYVEELAVYLHNLGKRYIDLGHSSDAVATMTKSISLFRPLYEARPEHHQRYFARSLLLLSMALSLAGDKAGALDAVTEAAALDRMRVLRTPGSHAIDLSVTLAYVAEYKFALGRADDEVLATMREAIDFCRQAVQSRPQSYTTDLASQLRGLAAFQASARQHEAALTSVEEALRLQSSIGSDTAKAHQSRLASTLYVAAQIHAEMGKPDEAKEAREKSLALVEGNPLGRAAIAKGIQLREERARAMGCQDVADAARIELQAVELR